MAGKRPSTKVHSTTVLLNSNRSAHRQDVEAVLQEKCQVRLYQIDLSKFTLKKTQQTECRRNL